MLTREKLYECTRNGLPPKMSTVAVSFWVYMSAVYQQLFYRKMSCKDVKSAYFAAYINLMMACV